MKHEMTTASTGFPRNASLAMLFNTPVRVQTPRGTYFLPPGQFSFEAQSGVRDVAENEPALNGFDLYAEVPFYKPNGSTKSVGKANLLRSDMLSLANPPLYAEQMLVYNVTTPSDLAINPQLVAVGYTLQAPAVTGYINFLGQAEEVSVTRSEERPSAQNIHELARNLSKLSSAAALAIPGLREMTAAEQTNLQGYYKKRFRKV